MYRTEYWLQAGNDAYDDEPGKTGTGGVIPPNTKFHEVLKAVVENIADVSSSDREDKTPNMTNSPRKRKAIDPEADSSESHSGLHAEALKEKRKRAKREKQKSKNKSKDNHSLRGSEDSVAVTEDSEGQ
jgi:hypothetical protein